jgi:hypothetical protein
MHVITWIELEKVMLGEMSQGQMLYDSMYMRYIQKMNSLRQKMEWWLLRDGGRWEVKLLFNSWRVFAGENEKVLGIENVMVIQHHEYI